jgi:hypothetical protein
MSTVAVERQIQDFREHFLKVREEISRVIVGNEAIISGVMTCLLARGHVLLEGIPGVGKTKLVQTMADVLHLKFSRIQFTPDLMPGDIIGTNIVREDDAGRKSFEFQHGPIFANILLADEINRATPKTQSGPSGSDAGKQRFRCWPHTFARSAVLRPRHAEPDRNGRHLPAPRSADGPFSFSSSSSTFPTWNSCT